MLEGETLATQLNPAIVIGGGMTGLGVIRNLGRNGVETYCIVGKKDEATYSKYCKKYFIYPEISQGKDMLADLLCKLQSGLKSPAVVFPTSDLHTLSVSDIKNETDSLIIPIADRKTVETLINKKEFYKSLHRKNVPYPTTIFEENLGDCTKDNTCLSYPVFLKPSMSQIFSRTFGKKGFIAYSKEELLKYEKVARKQGISLMAQEIIPGPPTNHYFIDGYLNKTSKPLAIFARRRIRMWPLAFGNSTSCLSIPPWEAVSLKDIIVNYLQSIGFHGIFSAEFKKDPRDNITKLLEVNARSWWYNSFPAKCGINIIWTAYLDAIGKPIEYSEKYEHNVRLFYVFPDLMSSASMFLKRTLNFKEWVSSLNGKRDYAFFAPDDPSPAVMSLAYTLNPIRRSLKR